MLNAKQHEKEAQIVAQAGKLGAVTISTNMAGRGTDIMLGGNPEYLAKQDMKKKGFTDELIALATGTSDEVSEEVLEARAYFKDRYNFHKEEIRPEMEKVREAGGLFILGTERHESRRIDNQLRGRSGRQGDPGESRFYLSLEDDLLRLFGATDRIMMVVERLGLDEDTAIDARMLSGAIESAQRKIEDLNFSRRKNVLTYDDVMNQQRTVIYEQRREVLTSENITEKITSMIVSSVEETFAFCFSSDDPKDWRFDEFRQHYLGLLTDSRGFRYSEEELSSLSKDALREELVERALAIYHGKDALFASVEGMQPDAMREIEKVILLQNVDKKWMEHLDAMDELKERVGLNAYAQRDPVAIYRIEGADIFEQMTDDIKEETVRMIFSVVPKARPIERVQVATPISVSGGSSQPVQRQPKVVQKIGRNDPCPCGSGKKYKKCCGQNGAEANK